jgi:hypothetical protein
MKRLQPFIDLAEHLRLDQTLDALTKKKYVYIKAEYRGIDEDNQFSPAIWIIPMQGEIKAMSKYDCPSKIDISCMVCVVVRNVYDTRNNVGYNNGLGTNVTRGAYQEASDYEDLVRTSILNFNQNNLINLSLKKYDNFIMSSMPQADVHNGHLILPTIYKTSIVF